MSSDLATLVGSRKRELFVVKNVGLAFFIILNTFFSLKLNTWPRVDVQFFILVPVVIKVNSVKVFALQLREVSLVTSVVAFKSRNRMSNEETVTFFHRGTRRRRLQDLRRDM
jgi:hypothetical protein